MANATESHGSVNPNAAQSSAIWFERPDADAINRLHEGTAVSHLGIVVTAIGDDYIEATMPVDERTLQPFGIMHGGASLLLAETLASLAGNNCVDPARQHTVGVDVNASHVRAVRDGTVTGTVRPLHLGRKLHVWDVRVTDERGKAVCIARLTLNVMER